MRSNFEEKSVEALSYIVEETESTIMARFCEKLVEAGFEDFHKSAVVKASDTMKQLLGIDFMKQKSFARVFMKSRPHLFINVTNSSIIALTDSTEEKGSEVYVFSVFTGY